MHDTTHVAKPTSAQTCELALITSKTETRVDTRLMAMHLGAAPAIHADRGTGGGCKCFARGVKPSLGVCAGQAVLAGADRHAVGAKAMKPLQAICLRLWMLPNWTWFALLWQLWRALHGPR